MNEYILNIAVDGVHYARVIIKADTLNEAKVKAENITMALRDGVPLAYNADKRVQCDLTRWEKVGTPVSF